MDPEVFRAPDRLPDKILRITEVGCFYVPPFLLVYNFGLKIIKTFHWGWKMYLFPEHRVTKKKSHPIGHKSIIWGKYVMSNMPVYHHMKNKQKLMTQSQENKFGDRSKMGPIWTQLFFGCNNHQFLLEIIVVYHNIQNKRNVMIQSRENTRKPQILGLKMSYIASYRTFFFTKIGLRHFKSFIVG